MSTRQSSSTVSGHLDRLSEHYDGFDVQQTTVTVGPEEFESAAERGDTAEVRVRIEGSDGVLAVRDGEGWAIPGGVVSAADGATHSLSAVAPELVRKQTGVECRIDDLLELSLVCLQCDVSGDQVWKLSALFAGTAEFGTPVEGATWRAHEFESSMAF